MAPCSCPGGKRPQEPKHWLQTSEAHKFLAKGFQTGKWDGTEKPSEIYYKYPIFQQYKLDSFRQQYNLLKGTTGANLRNGQATNEEEEEGDGK